MGFFWAQVTKKKTKKERVAWESSYLLSSLAYACAALPGHSLAIRSLASEVERMRKDSVVRLGKRSLIAVLIAAADHVVQRDDGMRNHQDSLTKNIKYVVNTASCEIPIFSAPAFLQITRDLDPSLRLRKPEPSNPIMFLFQAQHWISTPPLHSPGVGVPLVQAALGIHSLLDPPIVHLGYVQH